VSDEIPRTVTLHTLHCDATEIPSRPITMIQEYVPEVGKIYQDAKYPNRRLSVLVFQLGADGGRDIVGRLWWEGSPPSYEEQSEQNRETRSRGHCSPRDGEYATSLRIFQEIWRPLPEHATR
jgi:hypothetical protein